jgi:2-dehydropantoate 2-reductase
MLAIDPEARSSMWEDLRRGRPTEIDYLQGAVLTLARKRNVRAPVTEGVVRLVKEAERAKAGSPGLTPELIQGAISSR